MKNIYVLSILVFFFFSNCSQKNIIHDRDGYITNIVYRVGDLDDDLQVLKRDTPKYPLTAKKLGMEGIVVVKTIVGYNGNVENVSIAYGCHEKLNKEALNTAKDIKFKPGYVKGKKVKFSANIPFIFWLNPSMVKKIYDKIRAESDTCVTYEKNGDIPKALENYDKIVEIINDYSKQLLEWAEVYKAKYSQAELAAIKVNSTIFNPYKANALYRKGRIYSKQHKYDLAIDCFKTAISLDSSIYSVYGSLGWAYYLNKNYAKCIEYSEKLISQTPTALYAHYNIGLSLLNLGEVEKAKIKYQIITDFADKYYIKISEGTYKDLYDLIKKDIYKNEAEWILINIFKLSEQEIKEL